MFLSLYADAPNDLHVYDFVFDRLRAIRQDLVVQQVSNDPIAAQVIEICVKFHLVAGEYLSVNDNVSCPLVSLGSDHGPLGMLWRYLASCGVWPKFLF